MEKINVLDESGNVLYSADRDEIHKKGHWHISVHVWIFVGNKLLIQKRGNTEISGGFWTISASGHVKSTMTPLDSAIEESSEEIGVVFDPEELTYLCTYKKSKKYENFIDNEFNPIFVVDVDTLDTKFDREEVVDIKLVTKEELLLLIEQIKFRPDRKEYHRLLFDYWDSPNRLDK